MLPALLVLLVQLTESKRVNERFSEQMRLTIITVKHLDGYCATLREHHQHLLKRIMQLERVS